MGTKLSTIRKSITQLPLYETINFLIYQVKLKSGLFRLLTPIRSKNELIAGNELSIDGYDFFNKDYAGEALFNQDEVIKRADKILGTKIKLFGAIEQKLEFADFSQTGHWSVQITSPNSSRNEDIKFTWELARFDWAIHLGQAYKLSGKEKYADLFWEKYYEFNTRNPANIGPNWASAQEVALRMIAWTVTLNLIRQARSTTAENIHNIAISIGDHADRIPPTLNYARAQNNNHLISEAVGLYTAGTLLKNHPRAEKWRQIGKKWFEKALLKQIDEQGEYIQHSTNYHRLMLTLAVWMDKLTELNHDPLTAKVTKKLQKATCWLINLIDLASGKAPNMGHNDGSLVLPFSTCSYQDYRPIIKAASMTFLRSSCLKPDHYDDLAGWLALNRKSQHTKYEAYEYQKPRIGDDISWGIIKASKYKSRPAHADQLHVDLWFKGHNILLDAGTYQYNAPPPWDNGLMGTCVHNTITIENQDQMTRASRFLWLDWAQAHISEYSDCSIAAAHDGYFPFGAIHKRELIRISPTQYKINDEIFKMKTAKEEMAIDIHWLLPDWNFEIDGNAVEIDAPVGKVRISLSFSKQVHVPALTIHRAGSVEKGKTEQANPLLGWYSPTYGVKLPAISIIYSFNEKLPFKTSTSIIFS